MSIRGAKGEEERGNVAMFRNRQGGGKDGKGVWGNAGIRNPMASVRRDHHH